LPPIRKMHSFRDYAQFCRIGNVINHTAEREENRNIALALAA
jgi:hypothetical protein